jgi:NADPH-dependent glutamate synthase beta subunit-like oxidoreductase
VLLALGTLKPNEINDEFSKSYNVENGLDFLLRVNEYKSKYIGKNVVVIGGGYTSMDCA